MARDVVAARGGGKPEGSKPWYKSPVWLGVIFAGLAVPGALLGVATGVITLWPDHSTVHVTESGNILITDSGKGPKAWFEAYVEVANDTNFAATVGIRIWALPMGTVPPLACVTRSGNSEPIVAGHGRVSMSCDASTGGLPSVLRNRANDGFVAIARMKPVPISVQLTASTRKAEHIETTHRMGDP